tara:strand:+ start:828 stop:2348 length:1521 start_codon:yes stop_codon:yes gene_type:complete
MNKMHSPKPLMIMGTSSGSGKSLITTAICRLLFNKGETVIPFKGQNMSNNAWVDINGGEMAYSQAVQAWAANLEPLSIMNPVLLKPKGECKSEVIHLGKTAGIANAKTYYDDWFNPGWDAINRGINTLKNIYPKGRFIIEGAGSPVEVNLQHRDLTNLRIAKALNANCILVADIERGGVFAQIIGTLALLSKQERNLFKGIIINRFRGDVSLFEEGRKWIEDKTKIPVLGIMPWLKEIFPPEDSLDLLERKIVKDNYEIEIAVIKLPTLSNFSDIEPLEMESTVKIKWVEINDYLGKPDSVIIPGSKQTIQDLNALYKSGMAEQIKEHIHSGGNIFGICGGMQMMGMYLEDPLYIESSEKIKEKKIEGLGLIPISTTFKKGKSLLQRQITSSWPEKVKVKGFELHHGESKLLESSELKAEDLFEEKSLGWIIKENSYYRIAGTYLHGIFDNGLWRKLWINNLRAKKGLKKLDLEGRNYHETREKTIDILANSFEKYIDLSKILQDK